jgi:hypothetical protein
MHQQTKNAGSEQPQDVKSDAALVHVDADQIGQHVL